MLINELYIDNENGMGLTPDNMEVDYKGFRVLMKPHTFLDLAPGGVGFNDVTGGPMEKKYSEGAGIASPSLYFEIPKAWDKGNFSKVCGVDGHEGRHRMVLALKLEGNTPIETHIFVRFHNRKSITPEIISNINKGAVNQNGWSLNYQEEFEKNVAQFFFVKGPLFTLL